MKSSYDVIVVGAGPAGSLAAQTAAGRGLSVLLMEKKQEIGEPVRCAEGIAADGLRGFLEPDPRWVCARICRARLHAPGGSMEISDSRDVAFVLDRKIFDRELARRAAGAGADAYTKTQATGLIFEGGQVCGIKGLQLGEGFEARAKIVVAADGVESRVARWAGIDTSLKPPDMASCAQFHLANVAVDADCCDFFFGNEIAPGGYAWVFPKGGDEANVGLGTVYNGRADRPPVDYLKAFVEERFPAARVLASFAGGVPLRGRVSQLSAGGLLLVGDAGRLSDPVTGEGILNGMISGRCAGSVAADCIGRGDVSAAALQDYDQKIDKILGPALDRNYKIKEQLRKAGDRRLGALFSAARLAGAEKIPASQALEELFFPRSRHVASLLGLFVR